MGCKCNGSHHHDHNETCEANNHHEEDIQTINITFEDGSESKCQVVVILEIEDKGYIGLVPEGGEEVFLYGYRESEEGPELSLIEDEDEFDKVAEAYEKMRKEAEEDNDF